MNKLIKNLFIIIILILSCPSCAFEHTHRFEDGECYCGESDPTFEEVLYSISFVDYDGTLIKTITVSNIDEITYPNTPSREGYMFLGWDNDLSCLEGDIVVTALYTKKVNELHVGINKEYKTLSEALEIAENGDIIYLSEGVYSGAIINKEVEIRGNNYNINPSEERDTETTFTSDLIINASNVLINGVELTQNAKFTFDNMTSNVDNVSISYCKVTNSTVNDNNNRDVAPFNFVSNNNYLISNINVENCYIAKNNTGRPMAMYIVDVENLSVKNCVFLGGDTKKNYNDAVKIDNNENGNAVFGIRGNVVFQNNIFKDYYQYALWFRQYSNGNYLITDNKFVNIGQTADNHAAVNFISGLDINNLSIDVNKNSIINGYLLFRMDTIDGKLDFIECNINNNALQNCLGTYYIKSSIDNVKIDAKNNYYGVFEPSSDKFIGNIDYSDYYSDLYDLAGYEKIELKYNTTPYVEVNNSIYIDFESYGFDKDKIVWKSSDENIAIVNDFGEVTGIHNGTAVITAIAKEYNIEKSIIVEVYDNIEELDDVVQFVLSTMNSYSHSSTAANSRTNYGVTNPYLYSIFRGATTYLFEDFEIDTESYVRRGLSLLANNKVEYITIHDTWALPRTAKGLAEFFLTDETSIHYTVGNDGLYQIVRLTDKAAHAGDSQYRAYALDKTNVLATTDKPVITMNDGYFVINGIETTLRPYIDYDGTIQDMNNYTTEQITYSGIRCVIGEDGYYYLGKTYFNETYQTISNFGGNSNSIGIEMESQKGTDFYLNMQRTAKLVAMLMDKYNLTTNDVKMHNYFSGKNCAQLLKNNLKDKYDYQIDKHNIDDTLWDEFLDLCNVELQMLRYSKQYKFEFISSDLSKIKNNGRIINHSETSECIAYTIRITNLSTNEVIDINSSIVIPSFLDIDPDYITKR